MLRYYYAYGSNMNWKQAWERGIYPIGAKAGALSDYRLAFNKKSDRVGTAANVMDAPGEVTEGVLYWLACPKKQMKKMDGHEPGYEREEMPVRTKQGKEVTAYVYIAKCSYVADELPPPKWYLDHLLAGRSYISDDYYQRLSQVLTKPNTNVEPK